MRPEKMEKVQSVAYVIGGVVYHFEVINSEHQLRIDTELKHQERRAEEAIRRIQKEDNLKEDGYYVSASIVYKVFHVNTIVKKVTGDEAKRIKRMVKLSLQERAEDLELNAIADSRSGQKQIAVGLESAALDERFALEA